MKRTAGVARSWTRLAGGAAVTAAVLALLLLRGQNAPHAKVDGSFPESTGMNRSLSSAPKEPAKDISFGVPRFLRPEKPADRHFQARLIWDRAIASGGRVPVAAELFDGETRDPAWAPAMELVLKNRLRQAGELLANVGLKGTDLQAPECRTSTCRLEYHYTDQDLATLSATGLVPAGRPPYSLLVRQTGPFSRTSSDLRPEPIEVVDGVTRFKQVVYLVFGETDSDPDRYAEWVSETRRRHAEYLRTHGPQVRIKGLPPPEQR